MGAGRFTLNISRVNGSVAIDIGIVHGLESNVIRSRNPIRSGWEWRTEIRSCSLLYSIISIGMYKNQLQELAQRSCFNLPSYSCIREGPDYAPRFKATVNFKGETFESPTFCSTLRQAKHAAAEVALTTLANRGPSKALAARVLVSV
ncbi:hypothetical protein ACSBR2_023532 [Camellia fascicularis]